MTSRTEQARATRDRLIGIARELFAEHGYDGASLDQVQRRAGLSRGALYHHFSSKHALFEATLDAMEADIAAALARSAAAGDDPLDRLRAGSLAWLDLARDPAIRRIALLDAPSVLGWAAHRAIDERHTMGMIRTALNELENLERIPPGSAEVLSHALLATLNELGLYVGDASNGSAAHERAVTSLNVLLERLFGQDARALELIAGDTRTPGEDERSV